MERLFFMKEEYKGTYQRLKFLNKFYLYSEISTAFGNGVDKEKAKDIQFKPLDKYENEVINIFKCNPKDWPICLYDFTYKQKVP
mmetsp:Transcript_16302/g.15664  ORF Transcript_16302/g.15664 Transcript_16302/m.15664 type:complete len:84 (+) Transcript_16302:193-444(+)